MKNKIDLIHYYIVIPDIQLIDLGNLSKHITPANNILKSIIDNVDYFETLFYLPSIANELTCQLNYLDGYKKKIKGLNYDINILFESYMKNELRLFKDDTLACIFICDGVKESIIDEIMCKTKCPIITRTGYNNTITFSRNSTVKSIYDKFSKNIGKKINDENIRYFETQYYCSKLELKTRICTIYLDILILIMNNNINARNNSNNKILLNVLKKAGVNENDFFSYLESFDSEVYENIRNCLLNNYENLEYMPFDINICIPSVDFKQIMKHWDEYKKRDDNQIDYSVSNKVKSIAKKISKNVQLESNMYNNEYINKLILTREEELRVLNLLGLFFGYARKTPFIMMENVPTDRISESIREMKRANSHLNFKDITVINKNYLRISSTLTNSIDLNKMKEILKFCDHLKIFSDLPIEWLHINDIPVVNLVKFSRVPITPFNGLMHHAQIQNDHIIKKDSFSIMLINTLKKEDKELFGLAQGLKRFINDFIIPETKIRFRYIETNNKEEYLKNLNEFKTDIFINFGHGSFDEDSEYGVLTIGDEDITPYEINKHLKCPPKIVLLGSCETQVDWNINDNIASSFINSGTVSVIGAHFSILGRYTHHLFLQILYCISQMKNMDVNVNWADIISSSFNYMYIYDVFAALENDKLLSEYTQYCKINHFEKIDLNFHNRIIEFLKLKDSSLAEKYIKKREQNSIFYNSLYFTSLGSPELILFE